MTTTVDGPDTDHRWHRAQDYDVLARRLQFRNAALVASLCPDPKTVTRACDIGCGTGALTELLAERLPDATIDALDISPQMLAVAAEKQWPARVRFIRGAFPDVELTPRYDALFSNAALHWMHPRYAAVFASMSRLLVPGGLVCAATAGRTLATDRFSERLGAVLAAVPGLPEADQFDERRLTVDQITRLARDGGFEVEDAFMVERSIETPVGVYARWWVASGGPWTSGQLPATDAVRLLERTLAAAGETVTVAHSSVLVRLRKEVSGRA
jgi:SAM-dependent methyltransferase